MRLHRAIRSGLTLAATTIVSPASMSQTQGTGWRDPSSASDGRLPVTATVDAQNRTVLRWPTVFGLSYRVEKSSDMNSWDQVPGSPFFGQGIDQSLVVDFRDASAPSSQAPPRPPIFFHVDSFEDGGPRGALISWHSDGQNWRAFTPADFSTLPSLIWRQRASDRVAVQGYIDHDAVQPAGLSLPTLPPAQAAELTIIVQLSMSPPPANPLPENPEVNGATVTFSGERAFFRVTSAVVDTDRDGLPDYIELYATHTNPFDPDSDHNGLSDLAESPYDTGLSGLMVQQPLLTGLTQGQMELIALMAGPGTYPLLPLAVTFFGTDVQEPTLILNAHRYRVEPNNHFPRSFLSAQPGFFRHIEAHVDWADGSSQTSTESVRLHGDPVFQWFYLRGDSAPVSTTSGINVLTENNLYVSHWSEEHPLEPTALFLARHDPAGSYYPSVTATHIEYDRPASPKHVTGHATLTGGIDAIQAVREIGAPGFFEKMTSLAPSSAVTPFSDWSTPAKPEVVARWDDISAYWDTANPVPPYQNNISVAADVGELYVVVPRGFTGVVPVTFGYYERRHSSQQRGPFHPSETINVAFPAQDGLGPNIAGPYRLDARENYHGFGDYVAMVAPITFEVTDWNVELTPPNPAVCFELTANPPRCNIASAIADTFKVTCSVKATFTGISLAPAASDALLADWKLAITQDIVKSAPIETRYSVGTLSTVLKFLPCSDLPQFGFPSSAFADNLRTQKVSYSDSPGLRFISLWAPILIPSTGEYAGHSSGYGPLQKVQRDDTFVTWVYVQNARSGERRFLKWVQWKSAFVLDLDVRFEEGKTSADVAQRPVWIFAKIAEGDGIGPFAPNSNPRVALTIDSRKP